MTTVFLKSTFLVRLLVKVLKFNILESILSLLMNFSKLSSFMDTYPIQ